MQEAHMSAKVAAWQYIADEQQRGAHCDDIRVAGLPHAV